MISPTIQPFSIPLEDVAESYSTSVDHGLELEEARARLEKYGNNRLQEPPRTPLWVRLLAQFQSLIIGLLIVSAIIAGFLGEWIDSIVILLIVALNGILGFFHEDRAERALSALRKLSAPMAKVFRGGHLHTIPAEELVPGDVLIVEAGDRVSADARLVKSFGLQVIEASLTGESTAVQKNHRDQHDATTPLADRTNMVFTGTTVASGKGVAIVTSTGMQTEMGSIAGMLETGESEPTPLQKKLTELGRIMVVGCLLIVSIIFMLHLWRGGNLFEIFLISVSLAVAAIPEGLPAIVTITLAIGVNRMAKRKAIVRKLPSVETLGCVSVVCTDKTGTLTSNEMMVTQIHTIDGYFSLTGNGFSAEGRIVLEHSPALGGSPTNATQSQEHVRVIEQDMLWLLRVGAMCNNSEWNWNAVDRKAEVSGDPTEIALLVAAAKHAHTGTSLHVQLLHENPFDSDRKMMSQVYRLPDESIFMVAKGAPEVILGRCTHIRCLGQDRPLNAADREWASHHQRSLADQALRVLGLAYRPSSSDPADHRQESDFIFLGLVGMMDPPRPETEQSVGRCLDAGILPVMITGDHPATAMAIAKSLHITDGNDQLLCGPELETMTDEVLRSKVESIRVYARVSAQHKLRIVNAWKYHGYVVAMTGDGVNDAPAVKAADIGIVMGIAGSDVAKESSDMILADDNFATIINAVEEGRSIYENIQKFLHFLLACNTSEILFMFTGSLIGWPTPLVPIQILWINLVTDGVPALSLAMEPIEKQLMARPPRDPKRPFLPIDRMLQIGLHGFLMAVVALVAFGIYYHDNEESLILARTVAFCTIAMTQVFFSMGCRSFTKTMPQQGWFTNPTIFLAMLLSLIVQVAVVTFPWTSHLLNTVPLGIQEWIVVLLLSLFPVTLIEVYKLLRFHSWTSR